MPAMTETRKGPVPMHRFTWPVEKAFAPLARLHPATDEVFGGGMAALAQIVFLCAGHVAKENTANLGGLRGLRLRPDHR